ncbi:MAG: hypothetical protein MUE43_09655 [Serpentinimonas sp.]|nr:hypothetical protein [Serpentinimonas sp.]
MPDLPTTILHFAQAGAPAWLRRLGLAAGALALAGCAAVPPETPASVARGADFSRTFSFDGGQIEASSRSGICRVVLRGVPSPGATQQMRPALAALEQARCDVRVAVLDSGSRPAETRADHGILGDAVTLGAMLRNRGFQTEVQPGTRCHTPCLLVFAAGEVRTMPAAATPSTQLGFSQITPDHDFGRNVCATELSRAQQLTLTRYLRAMLPPDTALDVLRRLETADCRSTVYLSGPQALATGLANALR